MIASEARKADVELRVKVLRSMKEALKERRFDDAKEYGQISADIKERLRSHDYSIDDAEIQVIRNAEERRRRTMLLLDRSQNQFEQIWRQPTDPWGEPLPCFPMYERINNWCMRLLELGYELSIPIP